MARRKKDRDEAPPKPAGEAKTSLRGLLKDVKLEPPKDDARPPPAPPKKKPKPAKAAQPAPATPDGRPSTTLRGDDRIAYWDAYAGVKPLSTSERPRPAYAPKIEPAAVPPERAQQDDEARARLAALVAGGVRFEVRREGDEIRGARAGTPPSVLRALLRDGASYEATIDLHGMRADEAEREVVRFLRAAHRKGARRVCVVHGKGIHSEGGIGVLRDRVVHVLTEGGAAPVVLAFATASRADGGSGALIVELTR